MADLGARGNGLRIFATRFFGVRARSEACYWPVPSFAAEALHRNTKLLRVWRLVLVALLGLACNGCLFGRIVYYNTPKLDAQEHFDNRVVKASPEPRPLLRSEPEAAPRLTKWERAHFRTFDAFLESQKTRAFLVVRNGRILYERYFHGASAETEFPCFSMSKTFAATLVGAAVEDGLLPSLSSPITDYLPELSERKGYRDVTLDQLLRMTSGIDFGEESMGGAQLYYTKNLRDFMYSYDVTARPGTRYLYGSVNVQLLWDALHRRLRQSTGETVSRYFERRVWAPLGAEFDASWSLDSDESGIEKFFGGFNARARDYARLGLLFLDDGVASGVRILPPDWVEQSLEPDPVAGWLHTTDGRVYRGKYQWFLTHDGTAYFAKGYNGQYVFVVPSRRMVFVRFGEGYGHVRYWTTLFQRLARQL